MINRRSRTHTLLIILTLIIIFSMDFIIADYLTFWIGNKLIKNIAYQFSRIFVTIGTLWGFLYLTLNKSLSYYYVKKLSKESSIWLIFGLILPIFLLIFYFLIDKIIFLGLNDLSTVSYIYNIFYTILLGIGASIIEEFLFRGFIFKLTEEAWNYKTAIILPSILFGIAHIRTFNLHNIVLTGTSGTLAGILFALIVYKTKSVWNAVATHLGWNLILTGTIIKISDKTSVLNKSILGFQAKSSNILLTGTEFGIESSLPTIIILIIGIFILLRYRGSKKNGK